MAINSLKKWTKVTDWDQIDQVMTIQQLCTVLRISMPTALNLLSSGKIPAQKVGNQWRIDKDAVMEYLRPDQAAAG